MTRTQHARILNIERVARVVLAQHCGKVAQVDPIWKQYQHGRAFDWQKLELELATVQHVHLPNVEKGGEVAIAQAGLGGDVHAKLLALFRLAPGRDVVAAVEFRRVHAFLWSALIPMRQIVDIYVVVVLPLAKSIK